MAKLKVHTTPMPDREGINADHDNRYPTLARLLPQGVLYIPRLTQAQINNLNPLAGFLVYNTTTNQFQGYNGAAWNNL